MAEDSPAEGLPATIVNTPSGWVVEIEGQRFGPFPHHGAAVEWLLNSERARERREQETAAEVQTEACTEEALACALKAAVDNPAPAPRGRPTPDDSREADIAFEYYWRLRHGSARGGRLRPHAAIARVAGIYQCTADHVRKLRSEYAPVADYDEHRLTALRAQAIGRRTKHPEPPHRRMPRRPRLEQAREWLGTLLVRGPMLAQEVYRRAEVAGFSRRTVERAKASLGIVSARGGPLSSWRLPPH